MPSSSLLPRLVLGAAILLTVAAGVKNYINKDALSTAREEAKAAQGKIADADAQAKKAAAAAKVASEKLKAAEEAKAAVEATSATAVADVDKLKKDAEEAQAQVKAKETEIADLKQKLTDTGSAPQAAPTPDPAIAKALEDAKAQALEKEQLLKTVQAKAEEADKKAATLEADNARRLAGLAKPGLEGKVLAVNGNWNFVVLSIGDRQGVVNGSSLIVKRGGSLVAKLRVTSVEPSTSIADIQPGSSAKGVTVQPGDVVIFPGS
ncbi:MAG: hypothetical protein WCO68_02320 [Verrucomicrobiota bacterium]